MRIPLSKLQQQLGGEPAPVYLLSGDEPLQLGEAADAVRAAARAAGYTNREVIEAASNFDWSLLGAEASSLSLFAEKKIIDLRLPSGKPGREGGAALAAYCADPPPDTLLLLTLPKLDKSQQNSKWFKAIDQLGVVVQIWPIEAAQLPRWIEQRMHAAGLQPGKGVAGMLAERIEGNLLAARQEIEKLLLLHGPGSIDADSLDQAVSDNARFDVFILVDSALQGDAVRSLRILGGLRDEGLAAPVVLWALSREIRALAGMARQMAGGASADQAMRGARVWDKRKPLVGQGLQRLPPAAWASLLRLCQRTDAAIKGAGEDDPWRLLERITLGIAGVRLVTAA